MKVVGIFVIFVRRFSKVVDLKSVKQYFTLNVTPPIARRATSTLWS
jgi:hypothetical protein